MSEDQKLLMMRAIPDVPKRQLAEQFGLDTFFIGERADGYLQWLREYAAVLGQRLGYPPSTMHLRREALMVLPWDEEFTGHLLVKGIADWELQKATVKSLMNSAVAILLILYDDARARTNGS